MMAQFQAGRIQTAISAGNLALALNPNNPDAAAKLGMILFAAGYWQAAAAMAEGSAKSMDVVPHDAQLVLALDAYRRGDWSDASLLAEQVNCSDFVVRALRAASLGQLGSDAAAQQLSQLRSQNPNFESNFERLIAGRRYQPALVASMEEGLRKAGAHLSSEGLASAF
jgi:tetratricopeptide (TPR) repeat protein